MKRKNGFTLIELLVVVSIIALLVSILLPALGKARDQAKRVMCATHLHSDYLGIAAYSGDNGGAALPHALYADDNSGTPDYISTGATRYVRFYCLTMGLKPSPSGDTLRALSGAGKMTGCRIIASAPIAALISNITWSGSQSTVNACFTATWATGCGR